MAEVEFKSLLHDAGVTTPATAGCNGVQEGSMLFLEINSSPHSMIL